MMNKGKKSNRGGSTSNLNVSVGFVGKDQPKPTKTSGVKTRGNGAAVKGTTARGPMG
jgi:hypothetical protein